MQSKTRNQLFNEQVEAMIKNSPYRDNEHLNHIYLVALLRTLLVYSAVDCVEVRRRVQELGLREAQPSTRHQQQRH